MEETPMYVGSAKELPKGGISVQLDLTDLWEHLKGAAKEHIKSFFTKDKKEHKYIVLSIWPLKPENVTDYRTHSVKINTYKPEKKAEQPEAIQKPEETDEIPF